jgi:hypothetical protein
MSEVGGSTRQRLYEPPALRAVGSLRELTQAGQHDVPCFWTKTIGPPDYFTFIPIANCSS